MRGAGCTYNDIIDIDIDSRVSRTMSRPLASGEITLFSAYIFLLFQLLIGLFCLLLLLYVSVFPFYTFLLSVFSLLLVCVYPFMKRITFWAQFFLGLCFSWGIFLGWFIVDGGFPFALFLLYFGCIFWVMGYDTIYAHQDTGDDSLLGLKSTALLFGEGSRYALFMFYSLTMLLFFVSFYLFSVGIFSYIFLLFGCIHLFWQVLSLDINDKDKCLSIFCSNYWFGLFIFVGLLLDYVWFDYL